MRYAVSLSQEGDLCQIDCDRLGGRKYYGPLLDYLFGCQPTCIEETPEVSRYELTWEGRDIQVSYAVNADDTSPAVGLASMMCKYVRELFMIQLNQYWSERVEGLKPTAGYYTDGKHFLEQIDHHLTQDQTEILIRSR